MKRAIVIVLDGCGAGEAPDAPEFGDADHPSTIKHVWDSVGGIQAPTLQSVGFFAAGGVSESVNPPLGFGSKYGRLREISMGKDSVTGHWEMMGIHTEKPFPTYPNGFPILLVKQFEEQIGTQTIGNRPASGTAIIQELGSLHMETGFPILYTSADSVFQLACHEDIVPIEKLYEMCRLARLLCVEPNNVQRVIARPFVGSATSGFVRTERRKDFPLPAPANLIDQIGDVFGIGVIPELFDGRGFRAVRRTQSNEQHAAMLEQAMDDESARFIFANFEDFDMLYGHRNDAPGFARAFEQFDPVLAQVLGRLTEEDVLILTADHGNDPTSASTDHSREYVPACVICRGLKTARIEDVDGMMAIGATVAAQLGVDWKIGKNLLG